MPRVLDKKEPQQNSNQANPIKNTTIDFISPQVEEADLSNPNLQSEYRQIKNISTIKRRKLDFDAPAVEEPKKSTSKKKSRHKFYYLDPEFESSFKENKDFQKKKTDTRLLIGTTLYKLLPTYSATEKFDRCLRRRYRQVFSINRYVYLSLFAGKGKVTHACYSVPYFKTPKSFSESDVNKMRNDHELYNETRIFLSPTDLESILGPMSVSKSCVGIRTIHGQVTVQIEMKNIKIVYEETKLVDEEHQLQQMGQLTILFDIHSTFFPSFQS